MRTFVLFASSFENTALKGPRSVQADLFDFVVPAWSDGTQADMDVSERIRAELDAGHPCRHDDDVGERSIMNHFVVKFFSRIQVELWNTWSDWNESSAFLAPCFFLSILLQPNS